MDPWTHCNWELGLVGFMSISVHLLLVHNKNKFKSSVLCKWDKDTNYICLDISEEQSVSSILWVKEPDFDVYSVVS